MKRHHLIVLVSVVMIGRICVAQCTSKTSWNSWLNCVIDARVTERSGATQALVVRDGTVRNGSKKAEGSAIESGSTSLVDQTSRPDLLGLATHLARLDSKAAGSQQDSFTFSTSAYALYAMANKRDPLDPAFYAQGRQWRRISFSVAREVPDDKSSNVLGPDTAIAGRVLILDGRDLARAENVALVQSDVNTRVAAAVSHTKIDEEITRLLDVDAGLKNTTGEAFKSQLATKLAGHEDAINAIIDSYLAPLNAERQLLNNIEQTIRKRTQWSLNVSSKRYGSSTPDEYRFESAFDLGPHPRITATANAGFTYINNKSKGANTNAARAAGQIDFRLTQSVSDTRPIIVSIASEGQWHIPGGDVYQVQAKTSIPFLDGLEVPVALTWANRTQLQNRSEFRIRFNFNADFARLMTKVKN
jgi:hypothetical protein